jgi:hypothetical protein
VSPTSSTAVLHKAGDAAARSVPVFAAEETPDYERGILRDLAGIGVDVNNLGQLIASAIPYPEAVPVFLDWAEHLEERVEPEYQSELLRSLGFLLQRPEKKGQTYPVLIRHVKDNKFDDFTLRNVALTASMAVTSADFDDVARVFANPDSATYMTRFLSPFIRDSGRPEAPKLLMDALPVRSNTTYAATALADLEITDAIPLIEDARQHWDPKTSNEVLRILAEALYRLRRALYAREHEQASGALTEQDLTSALRNPHHPDETGYAAHFLAELGVTDALPDLETLPKHPDTWVRTSTTPSRNSKGSGQETNAGPEVGRNPLPLLPREPIHRLPEQVGVAIVSRVLLDHVDHDPPQAGRPTIGPGARRQPVQAAVVHCFRD